MGNPEPPEVAGVVASQVLVAVSHESAQPWMDTGMLDGVVLEKEQCSDDAAGHDQGDRLDLAFGIVSRRFSGGEAVVGRKSVDGAQAYGAQTQ